MTGVPNGLIEEPLTHTSASGVTGVPNGLIEEPFRTQHQDETEGIERGAVAATGMKTALANRPLAGDVFDQVANENASATIGGVPKPPIPAGLQGPPKPETWMDKAMRANSALYGYRPDVVPHREGGGTVEAGRPYEVGEKGPEVIVPDQAGEVIPNDAQAAPQEQPVEMASAAAPATATGKASLKPFGGSAASQPSKPVAPKAEPKAQEVPPQHVPDEISQAAGLGNANQRKDEAAMAPTPEQIKAQSQVPATNVHNPQELAFQRSIVKDNLAKAVLNPNKMQGIIDTLAAKTQMRTLNEMNPYGSEANHPGIMGKIEHGLAKAGNIAGDIVAPGTMANIPGTELNQQEQAASQDKQMSEALTQQADTGLKAAQANKANTPVAIKPQEQLAQNKLDAQNRLKEITVALQNPNIAPADKEKLGQEQEQIYATDKELRPETQQNQPIGDAGAKQHEAELNTMVAGMTPDQAQNFKAAFGAKPEAAGSVATKRIEDAKAVAAMTGAERDRALARTIAENNKKAAANAAKEGKDATRSDKSYQFNVGELNKLETPVADSIKRLGRLQDTLDQGSPQADALIAPELLTVMAGGQGSGLRMNEAEISRIVGGRSKWESLQASINKWKLDPATANSITPEQRQEIKALVKVVDDKLKAKQAVIEEAHQALVDSDDPHDHRRTLVDAHKRLSGIDNPESKTAPTRPTGATHQGVSSVDGKSYYLDANGKKLGPVKP